METQATGTQRPETKQTFTTRKKLISILKDKHSIEQTPPDWRNEYDAPKEAYAAWIEAKADDWIAWRESFSAMKKAREVEYKQLSNSALVIELFMDMDGLLYDNDPKRWRMPIIYKLSELRKRGLPDELMQPFKNFLSPYAPPIRNREYWAALKDQFTGWAMEKPKSDAKQAAGQGKSEPSDAETGCYSVGDLARKFKVNAEALRKRLDRWRYHNDRGWIENPNRGGKQPTYLYDIAAVRPVIEAIKSQQPRRMKTSIKRPIQK
jgi:hypothetical protein